MRLPLSQRQTICKQYYIDILFCFCDLDVDLSSKMFDIWDKRLWDMVDFNHKPQNAPNIMVDFNHKPKTPLSPMSTRWLILTTTPFSQPYKVG